MIVRGTCLGARLHRRRVCLSAASQLRSCAGASAEPVKPPEEAIGLKLGSELCVYESSVDLNVAAENAFKKCQIAASMGTVGFAGIIVAASTKASMPVLAGLAAMALANTYVVLQVPRRAMQGVALKQVERITLLPNAETDGEILSDRAKQLAATETLQVEIRSPNLVRRLYLEPPPSAWQGARYSGLVEDKRRSFADACKRLHVDPEDGECKDRDMLDAVLGLGHVIAEEKLEIRSDVEGHLRIPLDGAIPAGGSLKEAPLPDADMYEPPEFVKSTPADAIEALGRRSVFTGMALLALGGLATLKHLMRGENKGPGKSS